MAPRGPQPADDLVLPFHLSASRMSGRIVRLGAAVDTILSRHDYPDPVCHALGDALALTAMIATALRFDGAGDGRFIFQTRTDGPIGLVVVHYDAPGRLRGYAAHTVGGAGDGVTGRGDQGRLLGKGTMAMTIDPGGDLDRYQGIVPLEGQTLLEAAQSYFRQSEQLPTYIRLALARIYAGGRWSWRAGGLMLQHIPREGGMQPPAGVSPEAFDETLVGDFDENWRRVRLLAETVEDHELLDPTLTPEQLLLRLFHEEGIRVTDALPLAAECRCSRDRIKSFLDRFGSAELADMREPDGAITVTCEFCSTAYRFEAGSVA